VLTIFSFSPKQTYCDNCEKTQKTYVKKELRMFNFDGNGMIKASSILIKTKLRFCLVCGHMVYDDKLDNKMSKKLKRQITKRKLLKEEYRGHLF